jgi:insulin-like growth factor 2 mRNA-binding protein 1
MNGYHNTMMGSINPAEPVAPLAKRRPSNRIQIRNLPTTASKESIEQVAAEYGTVKKCSIVNAEEGTFATVIFDTPEEAQRAIEQLNGFSLEGAQLQAEIMNSNPAAGRGSNGKNRQPRNQNMTGNNPRGNGLPLRIMVPSEYVGAIIGRKGQTIRNITTRCKARVDVHGKENSGLIEKVISIYGQPENCSNACKEILQVMQQESTNNNRGEVMLKMLADDRYCGRIIGKEGKMIKKIREDTGTKITVSNAQEMAALFPDRVIAIRGGIDNISQAEQAISSKLAECIEHEVQQGMNMPPGMMMPPIMPRVNAGGYYPNAGPYDASNFYQGPMFGGSAIPPQQPSIMNPQATESLQISVPNAAVGAIIGAAGANIKQIMRESAAFVNIETKKDADPAVDRIVTIKGNPDACWRASYMVFEKLKLEGFAGNDDVRLKTSLRVPKTVVGRIIGKGGKNVRELQRVTGAMVKLPEDPSTQGDEVTVEVFGNFMSIQGAHSRIRAMANQTQQQTFNGPLTRGQPRRSAPPESHQ